MNAECLSIFLNVKVTFASKFLSRLISKKETMVLLSAESLRLFCVPPKSQVGNCVVLLSLNSMTDTFWKPKLRGNNAVGQRTPVPNCDQDIDSRLIDFHLVSCRSSLTLPSLHSHAAAYCSPDITVAETVFQRLQGDPIQANLPATGWTVGEPKMSYVHA